MVLTNNKDDVYLAIGILDNMVEDIGLLNSIKMVLYYLGCKKFWSLFFR